MRSQKELEKVEREIQRKQRHCVKLHDTKDIFAIFIKSSLISEMCSLFPNYGKHKAPLGSCQQ